MVGRCDFGGVMVVIIGLLFLVMGDLYLMGVFEFLRVLKRGLIFELLRCLMEK